MTTFSDSTVRTLLVLALQMVLVLGVGLVLAWSFRRKGPAWQIAIYRTSLLATLLLFAITPMVGERAHPALSISAPPAGPLVALPSFPSAVAKPKPARETETAPTHALAMPDWNQIETQPLPYQNSGSVLSVRDIVVLAWLIGASVFCMWILIGQLALLNIRRKSALASLGLQSMLAELCLAGGYPIPELRVGKQVRSPFVAGVLRPCIYFPQDLTHRLPEQEIQAVLAHEIAHVVRRDCLWTLISKIYCGLFWPNPLAWIMAYKMEAAGEELCDQIVIESGLKRKAYAECLLRIAEGLKPSQIERLVGSGVFPLHSAIGKRISLVLDSSHKTVTSLTAKMRVLLAGVAAAAIAGVVFLIAGNQSASAQTPPSDPKAAAILKEMVDAYGSLQTYSANVDVHTQGDANSSNFAFIYKQPGYAKITVMQKEAMIPAAELYAEPHRVYLTSTSHPNSYVAADKPDEDQLRAGSRRWPIGGYLAQVVLASDFVTRILGQEPVAQATLEGQATLGADEMLDGVDCKTVTISSNSRGSSRWGGAVNFTNFTTLEIGAADRLVRRVVSRSGTANNTYVETTDYTKVKHDFPVSTAALEFKPTSSMATVADTFVETKPDPAVQAVIVAFRKAVQDADTLSFTVDDVDEVHKSNPYGSPNMHSQLAVQMGNGRKAHVKLSMNEYPKQDLEIISDGNTVDTLFGLNATHYLEAPYQNGLFNAGTPIRTFPVALDVVTRSSWMNQYLQGKLGPTETVNGEPADVIVYKRPMHDRYGFPMPSAFVQSLYFSRQTHMLLKTVTTTHYALNKGKPEDSQNVEIYHDIKFNDPIPDSTFKFVPGPGMTPTKKEVELRPGEKRSLAAIDMNLRIGETAPDFKTIDLNGNPISLSQYRGKIVVLQGWQFGIWNYSWDMPAFEKLYKKYRPQGLVMLGIPYEAAADRKEITEYVAKNGISYPQLFDGKGKDDGIQSVYKMGGRCFAFVIDRQGKVFAKTLGAHEAEPYIKLALTQK